MSIINSPYSSPEKFGLKIVGKIDWSSGYDEFNLTVVWTDENSQLYYGDDSGCSCPAPFENTDVTDLTPCTFHELTKHLRERAEETDPRYFSEGALINLIAKARQVGARTKNRQGRKGSMSEIALTYKKTRYTVLTGSAHVHIVPGRNKNYEQVARCGYVGKQEGVNQMGCVTCPACQDITETPKIEVKEVQE